MYGSCFSIASAPTTFTNCTRAFRYAKIVFGERSRVSRKCSISVFISIHLIFIITNDREEVNGLPGVVLLIDSPTWKEYEQEKRRKTLHTQARVDPAQLLSFTIHPFYFPSPTLGDGT